MSLQDVSRLHRRPCRPILFQHVTHMASSLGNGKNRGQEVNLAPVPRSLIAMLSKPSGNATMMRAGTAMAHTEAE
jgi:hypothetical protein